mgnify:CR=1 FL=1
MTSGLMVPTEGKAAEGELGDAMAREPQRQALWRRPLLGHHGALVRVDPKSLEMKLHCVPSGGWCKVFRFIHLQFDSIGSLGGDDNQLYGLTSDLLDTLANDGLADNQLGLAVLVALGVLECH